MIQEQTRFKKNIGTRNTFLATSFTSAGYTQKRNRKKRSKNGIQTGAKYQLTDGTSTDGMELCQGV